MYVGGGCAYTCKNNDNVFVLYTYVYSQGVINILTV